MLGLRKRDLLFYLSHNYEADANDVARAFAVRYSVAAMALLRLVRQGLATRDRPAEQGMFRYRLSERGRSRLLYLERHGSTHTQRPTAEPPTRP